MSFLTDLRLALAQRVDSWANTLTGVGNALGKTDVRFRLTGNEFLSLIDLENLYNFDGIAARVVDAVPKHALRQGFTVSTGDAEQETAIHAALEALRVVPVTRDAWTWGRLYGGGAIFIGADDGRAPEEPLDERNLRAVRWVTDVDRRDLYPMTWVSDPMRADFGRPSTYRLTRMGGTATETVTVHASRVIRFEGTTPTRRRRLQLQGWGDSTLQRVYAELQAARGAFAAAGVLLQEASQGVLKIKDLMDMMASDTDDTMKRRLELMDQGRSVARALLLDADGESFERVEVGSLTGVVDVMDRMVRMVAAVSGIPVTVLMGQAPAGLNATGDSDIRSWYDEVASERAQVLTPRLSRLLRLLMVSQEGPTGGIVPKGWKIVLPSLWQMTPKEQAELRYQVAQTDQIYLTAQVLTPEEVGTSRFRREGWSDDTSIDLDAREAAMEADAAAPAAIEAAQGTPKADSNNPGLAVVLTLPPDVARAVALPGGDAPEDLHCTLAFLGLASDYDEAERAELEAVVRAWAADRAAIPATLNGVGRFAGGVGGDPLYLAVDAPRLAAERAALAQALVDAGHPPRETHGYTPHVTLRYVPATELVSMRRAEPVALTFAAAAIWAGQGRVVIPFGEGGAG